MLEGRPHERCLWGGAGNGRKASAPRQSFTRQLFFKGIKRHLRIKVFCGISEDAVKTRIRIAVRVCVLVTIVGKRLGLVASLRQILQVLSIPLFE